MGNDQNRYGIYRQIRVPRQKRTILMPGDLEDSSKWYKCWNCGSPCDIEREQLVQGEYGHGGSVPTNNLSLLLHMDGTNASTTFTDSSPYGHTVTASGDAQISTAQYKFSTASGLFDGTGDYLTLADNAAFDLSGGYWTIDWWMRGTLSGTGTEAIYFQRTDANNYFIIYINKATAGNSVVLSIYEDGSAVVSLSTDPCLTASTWHHVEVSEYLNNYRIFVDGKLQALSSDSDRPADYTGTVYIGTSISVASAYAGYLDEFRIIKSVAHLDTSFTVPAAEYDESGYIEGYYKTYASNGCWFCGCTNYK